MEVRRLTRIAPWKAGKTLAVVYFFVGVVFAIPFGILASVTPEVPGQTKPSMAFIAFLPVLYALGAAIFVPLSCWMYNTSARYVGGIEVVIEGSSDV